MKHIFWKLFFILWNPYPENYCFTVTKHLFSKAIFYCYGMFISKAIFHYYGTTILDDKTIFYYYETPILEAIFTIMEPLS